MGGIYKKKILIAEHDIEFADTIVRKLVTGQSDTFLARDAEDVIAKVRGLHPDLVLLDLKLPPRGGFYAIQEMKKEPKFVSTPIIVISEAGETEEITNALDMGVKDYIIRSQFDAEDLINKINAQLEDQKPEEEVASRAALRDAKVLIVEDDKFLRDLATQKLSREDIQLHSAVDGEEGIQVALEVIPDVVLLDIMLPGIDGFEVLRQIREDERMANTAVIMLSNLGQREDIEKAQSLGADMFLIKASYTLDEIVEKVTEVIAKKKKQ